MPTTYLIRNAKKRAPWDLDVPTFPPLPEDQKHLESKRYLHTENVVVTCACKLKKVSNLTTLELRRDPEAKIGVFRSGGVGSKFESTRFKLRRPLATTLVLKFLPSPLHLIPLLKPFPLAFSQRQQGDSWSKKSKQGTSCTSLLRSPHI